MAEPLHRSRDDRMLAGVAAGVAETLDADPSLVRIIWALLAVLTGGIAFVVYVVMAIVVPESPGESAPSGATWAAPGSPTAGDAAGSPPIEAAPPPLAGTASAPAAASAPAIAPPYATAMPTRAESRAARRAARRARRRDAVDSGEAGLILGVVLIVFGALFLLRQAVPWFDFHVWWPIGLVALGVLLIAVAARPGRPTE